MIKHQKSWLILLVGLLLTSCQIKSVPAVPTMTETSVEPVESTEQMSMDTISSTQTPGNISTEQPMETPILAASSESAKLPDYSAAVYMDDRSTPAAVIVSFANAINRHEYLRAYSYFSDASKTLGSLDVFTNSYNETDSVSLLFSLISSEGAAGSIYYTIPVLLTQSLTSGAKTKYANCYVIRLAQPANFGAPPITPMGIEQYATQQVDASMSDADAIASACQGSDFIVGLNDSEPFFESITDLSYTHYIDNRSGAIEVVSSLLNSINRKEYVRAYSYWQNPASAIGSYDSYAAGFSDTDTVTAVFGTVISDAGAGQYHYQVPLAMIVKTTTNTTQTFVGCYTLHLSNPGFQATVPFEPMQITAGDFTKVSNGVDVKPLLATACK